MATDRLVAMLVAGASAVVALAPACRGPLPEPPDPGPWHAWCAAYLDEEGRVVDDGQDGISHSEGQAWGMLLATAWRDEATFDRIWNWTRAELRVRDDGLLAWRWEPSESGGGKVTDRNNATDGDLLAAWALVRAGHVFGRPDLLEEGRDLAQAVRMRLVRKTARGPVLLPGRDGFESDDVLTVNLSYWIFPALEVLDDVDPSRTWRALARTGRRLVATARFGPEGLPPDWLAVDADGGLSPSAMFAPRFGWDAVRIPLYLAWAGEIDVPLFAALDRLWSVGQGEVPPAWVDLESGEVGDVAPPGYRAVHRLVREALGLPVDDAWPELGRGYYSDTLVLLAWTASREARLR